MHRGVLVSLAEAQLTETFCSRFKFSLVCCFGVGSVENAVGSRVEVFLGHHSHHRLAQEKQICRQIRSERSRTPLSSSGQTCEGTVDSAFIADDFFQRIPRTTFNSSLRLKRFKLPD